jgi:molybdopterin-guanine dinucleotide biosynthesis protein A
MGTDKGLLEHDLISWAEIALRKLQAVKLPVLLSVNEQQLPLYAELFDPGVLVKDDASLKIGGPLKGILSVHLHQPGTDLLVTACDMPDMQVDVLEHLLAERAAGNTEAVVFRHEGYIEPLSAIYTSVGLQKIQALYEKGKLNRFSLHHVLGVLNTRFLPMPSEWKRHFLNLNTPQDLPGK